MERTRPLSSITAQLPFSSVLGDPLAPSDPLPGTIEVRGGIDHEWLPLAGQTVAEVRRRVSSRFGLHAESVAHIGGRPVGEDVVVQQGQHLAFMRQSGEKGLDPSRRGRCRLAGGLS